MRRILAPILGLIAFLAACAANAQVLQRYAAGNWTITANATNGSFQNCTATSQYGGGASVLFMLTRTFNWGLGITNPAWNWRTGTEGDVAYWIDSYARRRNKARALSPTQLMILLADSQQLFQEIRAGNKMFFEPTGANAFSITLVGTSVALNELASCVRNYR
jgi:hypothetical protein